MKLILVFFGVATLFLVTKNLSYEAQAVDGVPSELTVRAPAQTTEKKPELTDGQIAAIVVSANNVDIEAGKLAESKSKNKEVKDFAKQMVAVHTSLNKNASDLVSKIKVTPEKNQASKNLESEGKDHLARLKKLKGNDFDKAYAEREVNYHQEVLDTIDNKLIPNATHAELKNLLETVRPTIAAHLEHSKQVAASLK